MKGPLVPEGDRDRPRPTVKDSNIKLDGSFSIDKTRFIVVQPREDIIIPFQKPPPRFVTVIPVDSSCLSIEEDWLRNLTGRFKEEDDVFHTRFLSGVIFTASSEIEPTPGANSFLHSIGVTWVEVMNRTNEDSAPPPGPYYVLENQFFEIWRLHDDTQGAFLTPLIPGATDQLSPLQLGGEGLQSVSIAVPSRLNTSTGPLSGLRVAVKDIFQIKGVKTSVCNRAYYELYPPPSKTAACIELLQQKGASIVGTTKLAAFAATEEPIECVDYQAPWNPRADGYQSPAGSSSGSGVAVASYPWLDIAIGSDTSGSGRRPGHWNGCFAHRPTHGVLPVDGYIPSFSEFDVPTLFGRSIEKCKEFVEHWYGDKLQRDVPSLTPAIIYPTDYMSLITNEDQRKCIDDFTADLEKSLGVKHQKVSFNDLWSTDPPEEAERQTLLEYMKDASRNSFFYDDYHNFDKFRDDYRRQFSKKPYISPPVRWQWDLSSRITREERDIAVFRLAVFRRWVSEKVLKPETQDTIILIPIENMSPRYRDEPLGRYFNPTGVPMLFLSPILKAPEFTIPIGQVPFRSKVTGNSEHLPVAISLLGTPYRDIQLMDIGHDCLRRAGRHTSVLPGGILFADSHANSALENGEPKGNFPLTEPLENGEFTG